MNQSETFENTHTTRSDPLMGKNDLSVKKLGFNDNNHQGIYLKKFGLRILDELKRLLKSSAILFFLIFINILIKSQKLENLK